MICKCGHEQEKHHHDHSCTALTDEVKLRYCKCNQFQEGKGDEMPKEKKAKKQKSEGRKSTLAGFVDGPFKVYVSFDGKERDAMVLNTGIIRYKEKEFTSPSGFANAVMKEVGAKGRADGWKVVMFNLDDKRVALNTLRGSKSPLKLEVPKQKRAKKAAAPKKAKSPRKPRAKKSKANGAAQHTDAISVSEERAEAAL